MNLADLAHDRRWTAWRNEENDGDLIKTPYQRAGRRSASDDPSTWLTHAEAIAVAEGIVNGTGGGVGIWFGDHRDTWLAGIDLDTCRNLETGALEPWAATVLDRFDSYAEVSPSGTGIKIFFAMASEDVAALRSRMGAQNGRQFKAGSGKHPPAVELYVDRRYFAVTWEGLEDAPAHLRVVPLSDVLWLIEDFGPSFAGKSTSHEDHAPPSDGILDRLNRAAKASRLVETALRNAVTMQGGSRSEGALGLGAALQRSGWSFADMKSALLACPATAEWAREKTAEGDRQFERIWAKASDSQSSTDAEDKPQKADAEAAPMFRLVDPTTLSAVPVPVRQWIVEDWLPVGCCTANYGDGGTGKTLLAQQLQVATASGAPWCGIAVTPCRSIGLYCEDAEDELHRRQSRINDVFERNWSDLGNMRWISGAGSDNTLATFMSDGRMVPTPFWYALKAEVEKFEARLVVLDTAADLFAGNENDRQQVRRFIAMLNGLALEINGAVLLNAHPSRAGMSTGTLDGGSTAWSNTVRSRWSLARPEGEDAPLDTPERVLTRRKANYASIGDAVKLRWTDGALVPVNANGAVRGAGARAVAEMTFLDLLDRCEAQSLFVSESTHSGNYAPKVFAKRPDARGLSKRDFETAMGTLFATGRIRVIDYTRNRHAYRRIARQEYVADAA